MSFPVSVGTPGAIGIACTEELLVYPGSSADIFHLESLEDASKLTLQASAVGKVCKLCIAPTTPPQVAIAGTDGLLCWTVDSTDLDSVPEPRCFSRPIRDLVYDKGWVAAVEGHNELLSVRLYDGENHVFMADTYAAKPIEQRSLYYFNGDFRFHTTSLGSIANTQCEELAVTADEVVIDETAFGFEHINCFAVLEEKQIIVVGSPKTITVLTFEGKSQTFDIDDDPLAVAVCHSDASEPNLQVYEAFYVTSENVMQSTLELDGLQPLSPSPPTKTTAMSDVLPSGFVLPTGSTGNDHGSSDSARDTNEDAPVRCTEDSGNAVTATEAHANGPISVAEPAPGPDPVSARGPNESIISAETPETPGNATATTSRDASDSDAPTSDVSARHATATYVSASEGSASDTSSARDISSAEAPRHKFASGTVTENASSDWVSRSEFNHVVNSLKQEIAALTAQMELLSQSAADSKPKKSQAPARGKSTPGRGSTPETGGTREKSERKSESDKHNSQQRVSPPEPRLRPAKPQADKKSRNEPRPREGPSHSQATSVGDAVQKTLAGENHLQYLSAHRAGLATYLEHAPAKRAQLVRLALIAAYPKTGLASGLEKQLGMPVVDAMLYKNIVDDYA